MLCVCRAKVNSQSRLSWTAPYPAHPAHPAHPTHPAHPAHAAHLAPASPLPRSGRSDSVVCLQGEGILSEPARLDCTTPHPHLAPTPPTHGKIHCFLVCLQGEGELAEPARLDGHVPRDARGAGELHHPATR